MKIIKKDLGGLCSNEVKEGRLYEKGEWHFFRALENEQDFNRTAGRKVPRETLPAV